MAKVEVGKGRSKVEHTPSGLRITIPAKKNYFSIVFLACWLVGWAFGEISALSKVLTPANEAPPLFMLVWLCGWTVGGAFALYTWLWNVKGQEIINISGTELQHIRRLPMFQRSKEYKLSAVSNLRSQAPNNSLFGSRNGMEYWGITGGSVVFDYGQSTHQFGIQLDDAEANHLVQAIKQRFKNL